MKKNIKRQLIILAVIFLLLIVPNLLIRIIPSKARLALPESATNIREEYDGLVFFDYSRLLKARIPKEDYPKFIEAYGLTTKYDSAIHGDEITRKLKIYLKSYAPKWWDDNNETITNCYFIYTPGTEYSLSVEYNNGWLYFSERKW